MAYRFDFEWDDVKAKSNLRKHDVSFEEAASAFCDGNAAVFHDAKHSDVEERFLLIAMSNRNRVLAVTYTRRGEQRLRLITARKATTRELHAYGEKD